MAPRGAVIEELSLKFVALDFVSQIAEKVGAAVETVTKKLGAEAEKQNAAWKLVSAGVAAAAVGLMAAGGAAATFGVGAVKAAADFNSQMMLVRTQAHDTQDNLQQLGQAVLALAPTVGIGPEQLAEGLYHVASVGYRGADAIQILKIAAEGAKVGMASLDDTAYALTSTMNTFGLKGDQAQATMATLNAIVGAGDMKFADLNSAIGSGFFAAGETFGVSIQSMGAALAYLTDRGASADEAATRLKMSINLLGAPSKQASGILKDLGLSQQEVTQRTSAMEQALKKSGVTTTQLSSDLRQPDGIQIALQDLVNHMRAAGLSADETAAVLSRAFGGGRSGAAIMSMVQHLNTLKSKFDTINDGQARFGKDFADTMTLLNSRVDQVNAGFQAWRIEIGETLTPVAAALLGWFAAQLPTLQAWGDVFIGKLIPAGEQLASALAQLLPPLGTFAATFLSLLPVAVNLAAILISGIAPVLQLIASHMGIVAPVLAGIVAMWAAWNVALVVTKGLALVTFLAELVSQLAIAASSEGILTAAQWLLNIAMDANPIGAVILLIGLLVTAIGILVTHWKQVQEVLWLVWNQIQAVSRTISTFIEQHKALALAIGVLGGPITILVGGLALLITHWRQVSDVVRSVATDFHNMWIAINEGAQPLDMLAATLRNIALLFGATTTQAQGLQNTIATLGGLRTPPSDAPVPAAIAARQALPQDVALAQKADTALKTAEKGGAPAVIATAQQTDKAAHAKVHADQAAMAKAPTPGEQMGGFFSGLGTAAHAAVEAVGGAFSALGSLTQSAVKTIGQGFSALGGAAQGLVSTVGSWFSQLGTLANKAWSAFATAPAYWLGRATGFVIGGLYHLQAAFTAWVITWLWNAAKWAEQTVNRAQDMIANTLLQVGRWAVQMYGKANEMAANFLAAIGREWNALPGQIWSLLSAVFPPIARWAYDMYNKANDAAGRFMVGLGDAFNKLPGQMWDVGVRAIHAIYDGFMSLSNWISSQIDSFVAGLLHDAIAAIPGGAAAAHAAHIQGFAAGGQYQAGSLAIVGESGPELFMAGSSGTIVPNGQFPGYGAGGPAMDDTNDRLDTLIGIMDDIRSQLRAPAFSNRAYGRA